MPKCPKCNKEIDHLNAVVTEKNLYSYDGAGDWEHRDSFEFDIEYFKCPLCYEKLDFADTDSADEFLSRKD